MGWLVMISLGQVFDYQNQNQNQKSPGKQSIVFFHMSIF